MSETQPTAEQTRDAQDHDVMDFAYRDTDGKLYTIDPRGRLVEAAANATPLDEEHQQMAARTAVIMRLFPTIQRVNPAHRGAVVEALLTGKEMAADALDGLTPEDKSLVDTARDGLSALPGGGVVNGGIGLVNGIFSGLGFAPTFAGDTGEAAGGLADALRHQNISREQSIAIGLALASAHQSASAGREPVQSVGNYFAGLFSGNFGEYAGGGIAWVSDVVLAFAQKLLPNWEWLQSLRKHEALDLGAHVERAFSGRDRRHVREELLEVETIGGVDTDKLKALVDGGTLRNGQGEEVDINPTADGGVELEGAPAGDLPPNLDETTDDKNAWLTRLVAAGRDVPQAFEDTRQSLDNMGAVGGVAGVGMAVLAVRTIPSVLGAGVNGTGSFIASTLRTHADALDSPARTQRIREQAESAARKEAEKAGKQAVKEARAEARTDGRSLNRDQVKAVREAAEETAHREALQRELAERNPQSRIGARAAEYPQHAERLHKAADWVEEATHNTRRFMRGHLELRIPERLHVPFRRDIGFDLKVPERIGGARIPLIGGFSPSAIPMIGERAHVLSMPTETVTGRITSGFGWIGGKVEAMLHTTVTRAGSFVDEVRGNAPADAPATRPVSRAEAPRAEVMRPQPSATELVDNATRAQVREPSSRAQLHGSASPAALSAPAGAPTAALSTETPEAPRRNLFSGMREGWDKISGKLGRAVETGAADAARVERRGAGRGNGRAAAAVGISAVLVGAASFVATATRAEEAPASPRPNGRAGLDEDELLAAHEAVTAQARAQGRRAAGPIVNSVTVGVVFDENDTPSPSAPAAARNARPPVRNFSNLFAN